MEISGIRSSMPFIFQNRENAVQGQQENMQDMVEIQGKYLIPDNEVEGVLNNTISMIGSDRAEALSVHTGLSESRVFALLGA